MGGKRVQEIAGENALGRNIKKLLPGRMDAIVEEKNVFQYHLSKTNSPDFFDAGVAFTEKVYVAFSPKLQKSEVYAKNLSNAMRELRATGKLTDILEKYGIKDRI